MNTYDEWAPYSQGGVYQPWNEHTYAGGSCPWVKQLALFADDKGVFWCPSADPLTRWDGKDVRWDTWFSMGINDWGWGDSDYPGQGLAGVMDPNQNNTWVNGAEIVNPSEFIGMGDSIINKAWDCVIDPGGEGADMADERPDIRHGPGGTVVYLDAHVEKYRPMPNDSGSVNMEKKKYSHLWRKNNQTKP
jgi:prepilin-type processing-associated H-X9-DG protein